MSTPADQSSRPATCERPVNSQATAVGGCGTGLGAATRVGVVRRQVRDVAPAVVAVTEHRCRYLLVLQHIPVARIVELVTDLSGARPSAGWVGRVLRETAAAPAGVEKTIRTLLTAARILHVDETGAKVTGARWWLHVASTQKLTTFHLDQSRGRAAINTLGVLPDFAGIAVHDAWASYDSYDCEHALCGAHIARELVAAAETHADQHWPPQAIEALFGLNTAAHDARDQGIASIPPEIAGPLLHAWRHAILVGLSHHPRRPGRKQSKTRNLLERLRDRDGPGAALRP